MTKKTKLDQTHHTASRDGSRVKPGMTEGAEMSGQGVGRLDHDATELHQQIGELTLDLQRQRADFENFRKQAEVQRQAAREYGQSEMIAKLLPAIDDIELATRHVPVDLADNEWARGVVNLAKKLAVQLHAAGITRIDANSGTPFDPGLHEAVFMDDEGGEHEVITEELRGGYKLGNEVIRPAMVKVARR